MDCGCTRGDVLDDVVLVEDCDCIRGDVLDDVVLVEDWDDFRRGIAGLRLLLVVDAAKAVFFLPFFAPLLLSAIEVGEVG